MTVGTPCKQNDRTEGQCRVNVHADIWSARVVRCQSIRFQCNHRSVTRAAAAQSTVAKTVPCGTSSPPNSMPPVFMPTNPVTNVAGKITVVTTETTYNRRLASSSARRVVNSSWSERVRSCSAAMSSSAACSRRCPTSCPEKPVHSGKISSSSSNARAIGTSTRLSLIASRRTMPRRCPRSFSPPELRISINVSSIGSRVAASVVSCARKFCYGTIDKIAGSGWTKAAYHCLPHACQCARGAPPTSDQSVRQHCEAPIGEFVLIHITHPGIGRQHTCNHVPVRHHAGALVRAIHQSFGEGREFRIVFNCHTGLRMHQIEVPPFPVWSRVIADELQTSVPNCPNSAVAKSSNCRSCILHDLPCVAQQGLQVLLVAEAFGVDLIDGLRAGRPCCEPAVCRDDLQTADRRVVPGSPRQLLGDRFAGQTRMPGRSQATVAPTLALSSGVAGTSIRV